MAASDSIKLADYLFTRLRQLGVNSVFGVPGDYNLRLLDFVVPSGLHWVGNCNELNAAYAADGYARMNGLSAVVTTFGVGELSAANGIAGAYAERSPVVHIVGTPPRPLQSSRALMHHTFSDGEYRRFAAMSTHITVAQTNIMNSISAPDQIDQILQQALIHSRPVYLEIPDDMPDVLVSGANLATPIRVPVVPSPSHEPKVIDRILERLYSAKQPLILVDGESRSLGILDQIEKLVKTTNWPTWVTVFGKGLVNEQLPNVYGLYAAGFGDQPAKDYFESADLILTFGPHYSDTNSYFYTTVPKSAAAISFKDHTIQIENDIYRDMCAPDVLDKVLEALDSLRLCKASGPEKVEVTTDDIKSTDLMMQTNFYRLVNPLFREGDIILAETGTASYGGRSFKLPPRSRFFTAVTWLSIGFMLPATLGAALAKREHNQASGASNQTVLIIGDGSLQMTAQEISVMIKEKLNILIFIINNEGYTIERVIHGRKQAYNDVPFWRHTQALRYFGADEDAVANNIFTVRTCGELQEVLENERVHSGSGVRLVEVLMEREDVQGPLLYLLNKQKAEEAAATEGQ
ncbi:Pyruvate decarboxylase [Penicillium macrosclerotiorum]|uniref:Pyruvate decarboxylase n=1 Tax=Penicillium macrosclerotiorum TaxID=303699 RepID=UPI0025467AF6|nr:Pyruvate decarboxylase [Penicillium macrosclerotiorum]KAJ5674145.1 Pyruvate decarboxylase [Penicillium macrosclerotiorum]